MAPETSNQKRKHGRLTDASRNENGAGTKEKPIEAGVAGEDADGNDRPKKRGRPALNWGVAPSADSASNSRKQAGPSKAGGNRDKIRRAPPSVTLESATVESHDASGQSPGTRRSNRDRRSADENPFWAAGSEKASPPEKSARALTRPTNKKASKNLPGLQSSATLAQVSAGEQEPRGTPVRRSRRDRHSADENPFWLSGTAKVSSGAKGSTATKAGKKGPGGPSLESRQGRTAEISSKAKGPKATQAAKKRPGRPSLESQPRKAKDQSNSKGPDRAEEAVESPTPKSKGRPRRSPKSSIEHPTAEGSNSKPRSQRRPERDKIPEDEISRRPSNQRAVPYRKDVREEEDIALEKSEKKKPTYRQLVPKTKRIHQSLISSNWGPLDEPAIAAVDNLIADTYRPVLLRLHDRGPRYEFAKKILNVVSARLNSRLRKGMPFPPPCTKAGSGRGASSNVASSYEDELDFERLVDANETLEATLNPLLHSVALLKSEKDREDEALEKDLKTLRSLETNARTEARSWRERSKRFHVLAGEPGDHNTEADETKGKLELVKGQPPLAGGLFTDVEDDDLKTVSVQIGSHMESLKGNLQQIEGILPEIARSRASLQMVLHKHLDAQQYEDAILG